MARSLSNTYTPTHQHRPGNPLADSDTFLSDLYYTSGFYQADSDDRPRVTLTYAQSLDGRIAGVAGQQLKLSGPDSMVMTHVLRSHNDGILVGIGTVLNDNPQLNVRLLPTGLSWSSPSPIILDTHLRTPATCKLLQNLAAGTGKQPWVICCGPIPGSRDAFRDWTQRKSELESAGAKVLVIQSSSEEDLFLEEVLSRLKAEGIDRLMVEGGQRVITSFLAASSLVDLIIVTIAPTFVGNSGISAIREDQPVPKLRHVGSTILGADSIIACVPLLEKIL